MTINRLPGIFALFTILLVAISFIMRPAGLWFNDELLIIAVYFAAAYWLLTLIMVASARRMNRYKKRFWLFLLISLPFFGGIIYQLVHTVAKRNVHKSKHPHLQSIQVSQSDNSFTAASEIMKTR